MKWEDWEDSWQESDDVVAKLLFQSMAFTTGLIFAAALVSTVQEIL